MQDCNIRPLGDWIAIKIDVPKETPGGIIIPETAQGKERGILKGTVIAVGPGDRKKGGGRHVMYTQVGDRVLFNRSPQTEVRPGIQMVNEEQFACAILEAE